MSQAGFSAGRLVSGGLKLLLVLFCLLILLLVGLRAAAAFREDGADRPATTRMIATPLGAVAVALSGPADGPPIMLVHGTAAWSGFWKDVAAHLAGRGWRVIAVDLPPFGWSEHDLRARYGRTDQAARLSAVLRTLANRPAVVVGHSFGAGATTELALRQPRQTRSLILVDAALGALDPGAGEGLTARALGLRLLAGPVTAASVTNPAALAPLLRSMIERKEAAASWLSVLRQPMRREGTTAAYAAWLPNLFASADDGSLSRRSAELARIRVPVALIWGEADPVTPIAQAKRLAELTRARSLAALPGVGHIPHIEDPDAFLAALDAAAAPDLRRIPLGQ